jgi:hypothetical protein
MTDVKATSSDQKKHPPSRTAPKYSTMNKMNPFESNIGEYLVNPI